MDTLELFDESSVVLDVDVVALHRVDASVVTTSDQFDVDLFAVALPGLLFGFAPSFALFPEGEAAGLSLLADRLLYQNLRQFVGGSFEGSLCAADPHKMVLISPFGIGLIELQYQRLPSDLEDLELIDVFETVKQGPLVERPVAPAQFSVQKLLIRIVVPKPEKVVVVLLGLMDDGVAFYVERIRVLPLRFGKEPLGNGAVERIVGLCQQDRSRAQAQE